MSVGARLATMSPPQRPTDRVPPGAVDALEFARTAIARDLEAARTQAGLTHAELAAKLGVDEITVADAERGNFDAATVEPYVARVLEACGLPEGWTPPGPPLTRS